MPASTGSCSASSLRAWTCIKTEIRRLLGRDNIAPGMIAAIQTHGELLHWHPHIHTLVTCGGFTPRGEFREVPELDVERLCAAWREAVFDLYLAEGKIEPEAVENMRTWPHSGFSVDQSVFSRRATSRSSSLVQYITRCPLSLARLVKVTATGQVVYKAEKQACRAFPTPKATNSPAGRSGISKSSRRWSFWPNSRNTFRPRARI